MDPQTDLPDLIEDLEVNIDELTSTLSPLLPPHTLTKTALPLPLLSKAQLHILAAYAIESVLFSALLTSGSDAKSHAIFTELARLKTYFAKTKDAEEFHKRVEEKEGRARLDVAAAGRFIKHGLSGNERFDELRRERVEREKERALEKARAVVNRKFEDGEGERTPGKKRKGGEEDEEEERVEGEAEEAENKEEGEDQVATPPPAKKKRGRPSKKDKPAPAQKDTPTRSTRSSAPKTRSEAGQTPPTASPAGATKGKGKGRGKK